MTTANNELRTQEAPLRDALQQAGATFKGRAVQCPFHDDKNPSGSIHCDEAGIFRFKCFGCNFGGDVFDVRARAMGRDVAEILRESKSLERTVAAPPRKPKRKFADIGAIKASVNKFGRVEAAYSYTKPGARHAEAVQVRYLDGDKKKFLTYHYAGDGFVLGAPPKPWPLYNRARLAKAHEIVICEGEKCVHAFHDLGIVATTSLSGASNAHNADWSPLAGKKVILWPDHDPEHPETKKRQGIEFMNEVEAQLKQLNPPPQISWIDPEILGLQDDGNDVVDFIELTNSDVQSERINAVKCALQTALSVSPAEDLKQYIEDSISGKLKTVPLPWPCATNLARPLFPGSVTVLCGMAGSTKSFMLLQAAVYWHLNDTKVAVYELEDDRAFHLSRVLAQLDQNQGLTDIEWIHRHPALAREALGRHEKTIASFAYSLHASPDGQLNYRDILNWIERQARAGCRVIVVDPITALEPTERPWIEDQKFMMTAKKLARDFGFSLVLATHPAKGKSRDTGPLDMVAGGAAFVRFAHSIMLLKKHESPKTAQIASPAGLFNTHFNRTLRLAKARRGPGSGLDIAFQFDVDSLSFSEHGVITKVTAETTEDATV